MSFLGRAKRFLQDLGTEGPSKTQTFNLACASGHRVRGERTEGYQALRCPSCGEGVFVLPRSPLPEPVAPAGAAATRAAYGRPRAAWVDEGPIELTDPDHGAVGLADGRPEDGPEIVWDEEPAEAPPRRGGSAAPRVAPEDLAAAEIEEARRAAAEPVDARPERAQSRRKNADAPARREPAASPGAARPARPRPARPASQPSPIVVEARPRARSGPRLGLIFGLLAFVIVASVGWRVWRNHRAQYPLIAERGRAEGIPALEAGDFDRAHQLLSAARSAVDALGGAVQGADEIRQAADEAAVFVNLCPDSLEDLLDEAGRAAPDAWDAKFESLYKGRYFLFDSFIVSTPQESGSGAYEIAYKVFPPGEASRFGEGGLPRPDRYAEIDLQGFEIFELVRPTRGTHVTFGAKLQSIAYESERKRWTVRLEPKGGVFITHQGALQASGWPAPEMVELPPEDRP